MVLISGKLTVKPSDEACSEVAKDGLKPETTKNQISKAWASMLGILNIVSQVPRVLGGCGSLNKYGLHRLMCLDA